MPSHPQPTSAIGYADAIAYLYGQINYERTAETAPYPFRLRRMNELLDRLDLRGIAGQNVPVVHIAGTKGKGSTSSMVASMLTASGYRTGLYTSPHLMKLEERFTVDGQLPNEAEVVELVASIRREADQMAANDMGAPTFFELTTAIALLHFRNHQCDAVVLEVGLGGKLDSTNVCQPAVTAITSIGFDHQHILGNTLAEIAAQKSGIIKPGIPVISGVVQADAVRIVADIAAAKHAPLFALSNHFECRTLTSSHEVEWLTRFDLISHDKSIGNRNDWTVPLDGDHQAANAAVACAIVDLLNANGCSLPIAAQRSGLAATKIAGRVERFRLSDEVDLILDTSHNTDSVAALCQCIARRAAGRPVTIVFGTSRDKEHRPMLELLCQYADGIVLTRYHGNPRFRDTEELLQDLDLPAGKSAAIEEDPCGAVRFALNRVSGPHLVVVCGSFFLAAEVRPLLDRFPVHHSHLGRVGLSGPERVEF